ncbi:hypothetical protein AKJ31_20390 [Vibrio hepatarius]|uniref:DNA topoisomerase type IA zn finger domain-containing protein n=1 Tax=Vibrio hepatarius TaxID=171383 RepID=A0A0M0HUL1_9VIBR|nr:hypothetical protein AKJ31_20390 [Vibrio hepatarius]
MEFDVVGFLAGQSLIVIAGLGIAFLLLVFNKARLKSKAPKCPKCGLTMVTRIASKGKHEGKPFWGCPNHLKNGCTGFRKK